jgi:uncharacterized protein (DUF2267 family)
VLRALRDHLPLKLSAALTADMPLLVRGAYFQRWAPADRTRNRMDFLEAVAENLDGVLIAPLDAVAIVFDLLDQELDNALVLKVRRALPLDARDLWPEPLSDRDPEGDGLLRRRQAAQRLTVP